MTLDRRRGMGLALGHTASCQAAAADPGAVAPGPASQRDVRKRRGLQVGREGDEGRGRRRRKTGGNRDNGSGRKPPWKRRQGLPEPGGDVYLARTSAVCVKCMLALWGGGRGVNQAEQASGEPAVWVWRSGAMRNPTCRARMGGAHLPVHIQSRLRPEVDQHLRGAPQRRSARLARTREGRQWSSS